MSWTFTGGTASNWLVDGGGTLAAGESHTCAIREEDHTLVCWGLGSESFSGPLQPKYSVVQVATSGPHSCAVDAFSITCWGENDHGQLDVPVGLHHVSQVAAAAGATCSVVAPARSLRCWGAVEQNALPAGPIAQVAAGNLHFCAITRERGGLSCWGDGSFLQATPPQNLSSVMGVATGKWHSCAITEPHLDLRCWGRDDDGQSKVPIGLGPVLRVVAGRAHTCAIGWMWNTVTCWGGNDFGQAAVPASLGPVVEIAAGSDHTCAVRAAERTVACWGQNANNQLEVPQELGRVVSNVIPMQLSFLLEDGFVGVKALLLIVVAVGALIIFSLGTSSMSGRGFFNVCAKQTWFRSAGQGATDAPALVEDDEECKTRHPAGEGTKKCRFFSAKRAKLPDYWTGQRGDVHEVVYVDAEQQEVFGRLLEQTYCATATQDRQCPGGLCTRQPGGCPCVQPGAKPGLPTQYQLRQVLRVQDYQRWADYRQQCETMRRVQGRCLGITPPVSTTALVRQEPGLFEELKSEIGEVYLWHGTSARNALGIAKKHFQLRLVGTAGRGLMYGQGFYLAESSTKADEYSTDDKPGGYYDGIFAMLLCRVALGRVYYTTAREEGAGDWLLDGSFDSVLGDRAKAAGTFREFMIRDSKQIYPEYIVLYERVLAGQVIATTDLMLPRRHLVVEVPLYWANYHRNLRTDVFCRQYELRRQLPSLWRLAVSGNRKRGEREGDKNLFLLRVRRVEHAKSWAGYLAFKQKLREELRWRGATAFAPAARALDGDRSSTCPYDVMTAVHLAGASPQEALSAAHLDASLNEHLLWHGTSEQAAERIAQAARFDIPTGNKKVIVEATTLGNTQEEHVTPSVVHGERFGRGAYFAEDLSKSLKYAQPDRNGVRHVLLCRVLCGDLALTEVGAASESLRLSLQAGKHCVLAHPDGRGPREFVVQDAKQVYPEYILEWC